MLKYYLFRIESIKFILGFNVEFDIWMAKKKNKKIQEILLTVVHMRLLEFEKIWVFNFVNEMLHYGK